MMNVVMLVKDRPRLTEQAICTLMQNTDVPFNVTVIDDASGPETRDMLRLFALRWPNIAVLRNETSKGITGQVRNLGVYWAEKYWGRGDWLYLSDNDAYFTVGWARALCQALLSASNVGFNLIGGQNHPYHHSIDSGKVMEIPRYEVCEYLALAGTSWLMRWVTWDRFGPLEAHAPGVCQSEDAAFCNRIREAGGKVGAIYPPVVYDCGITQTNGTPSVGADVKQRVEGVYYE